MENVMLVVVLKKELSTQEAAELIEQLRATKGIQVVKTMEAVMAGALPEIAE